MIFQVFICDPHPDTPEYDFVTYAYLGWPLDKSIPIGRAVGEWAWVGRIYG